MNTQSANLIESPRHSPEDVTELKVYGAMSEAVISSIQEFLQPFQSTPESTYVLKALTREDFFPKFYRLAQKLAEDCCQRLVQIIKSSSQIAIVRGAAPADLGKRIRDTAFKPLDEILGHYAGVAKKIEIICRNLRTIREELGKKEAQGGLGHTAQKDGTIVEPWASELELGRQEASLLQAQAQAFTRMAQYLKHLNELPAALLAYACEKCYAGEVNYPLQLEEVSRIQAEIRSHLANAMETLSRVSTAAKQELKQGQASFMANVQLEQVNHALEEMYEAKIDAKLKARQRFRKWAAIATVCFLVFTFALLGFLFAQ